eukprot:gene4442-6282_t
MIDESSILTVGSRLLPSAAFKTFLSNSIRMDGRGLKDHRIITVRPGFINQSSDIIYGSSQVQIGGTVVMCGINLMAGTPSVFKPSSGDIVCDVSLNTFCSLKYDQKTKHEDAVLIENMIKAIVVNGQLIDLTELCIQKDKLAFRLCISLSCLSNEGNIIEAMIIATIEALKNLKLPQAVLTQTDELIITKGDYLVDILRSLTIAESIVPIVAGIYDNSIIIDPTFDEEEELQSIIITVIALNDSSKANTNNSYKKNDANFGELKYFSQSLKGSSSGISSELLLAAVKICSEVATLSKMK